MRIANYSVHPKNYNQRRPEKLRRIADILLATILVVDPVMITIPDFPGKEWFCWSWNLFVVIFKFVSKTITDADVYHGNL